MDVVIVTKGVVIIIICVTVVIGYAVEVTIPGEAAGGTVTSTGGTGNRSANRIRRAETVAVACRCFVLKTMFNDKTRLIIFISHSKV